MPKRPEEYGYFTAEELKAARQRADARAPHGNAAQRGAGGTRYNTRQQSTIPQSRPRTRPQTARPVLNERQRALYEKAYFEKYGRYPYGDRSAQSRTAQTQSVRPVRQDRRQAFLADERERKIRESIERKRKEEERLRAQAEAARRAAIREEKRRSDLEHELAAKRRERENLRRYEAERAKLEEQRRKEAQARRRAAIAKREKLKRRRHRIRSIKFHLKVFAVALAAWTALAAFIGFRAFFTDGSDESRKVSYYFDGDKAYSADKGTAYVDGKACINFSDLADRYGFYTSGDSTSLKFVIPADDGSFDTIEFIIGSNTALVNGAPVALDAEARYIGSSLWVCSSVGELFDGGIEIKKASAGKIEVSKIHVLDEDGDYVRDKDGNYVYEDVSLKYKSMAESDKVDLVALYGDEAKGLGKGSAVTFKSGLSEYEDYMNPADSNEYLILVNNENTLDVSYIPDDLTAVLDTRKDGRAVQRMRMSAEMALEAMFIEMRAEGYDDVSVTTAFVSYNEQSNEFAINVNREMADNGLTEDEARAAVLKYCDEAGTCDLQTGLSAVMHNLDEASDEFAATPAYEWLSENCWKFGYVVRYPSDKNDITGHDYDPCTFRYVGRFAAEIMHNHSWCLEEYLINN